MHRGARSSVGDSPCPSSPPAQSSPIAPSTELGHQPPLLVTAALHRQHACAKVLLVEQADPNERTAVGGLTALHVAAMLGDARMVEMLLSPPHADNAAAPAQRVKADVHAVDDCGLTPLHRACMGMLSARHPSGASSLALRTQPPPRDVLAQLSRIPHEDGRSSVGVVRVLLANGADPNHICGAGEFRGLGPLHLAVKAMRPKVVGVLLETGALVQTPVGAGASWLSVTDIADRAVEDCQSDKRRDEEGGQLGSLASLQSEQPVSSAPDLDNAKQVLELLNPWRARLRRAKSSRAS